VIFLVAALIPAGVLGYAMVSDHLSGANRPAIARIPIGSVGGEGTVSVALKEGDRIDLQVYAATAEVKDRTDDDLMIHVQLLQKGKVRQQKHCVGIPWHKKTSGRGHNYPSQGCVTQLVTDTDEIRVGTGWQKGTGRAKYTGLAVKVRWATE
jgi:hypothetical protein